MLKKNLGEGVTMTTTPPGGEPQPVRGNRQTVTLEEKIAAAREAGARAANGEGTIVRVHPQITSLIFGELRGRGDDPKATLEAVIAIAQAAIEGME